MNSLRNQGTVLRIIVTLSLSLILLIGAMQLVNPGRTVQAHPEIDEAALSSPDVGSIGRFASDPQPVVIAQYTQDNSSWVWGFDAPDGSTITITVTAPDNTVLATATTWEGDCPDCGTGDYQVKLPDGVVAPGNTVTADFGGGLVGETLVVTITANIDASDNTVTGTAPADSYIFGNVNNRDGAGVDINTTVSASGVYTLDFDDVGWDIQPGDQFNIHVPDNEGNQTQYTFWLPYPDLEIGKWKTSGGARPGGRIVYGIYYANRGNGAAEAVQIVDTLPTSTTLAGDTSGVSADQDGAGTVTWTLGTLDASTEGLFFITLDVDGTLPQGDESIAANCAVITTTTDGDPDPNNNEACTEPAGVWDDEVEVNIDTWPNPEDPAPGERFNYTLRACNGRSVAAGPVWLTGTLPLSTTFVGWKTDPSHEAALWENQSTTSDQLALYATGLPGDWCGDIIMTLALDAEAPEGMQLQNTAIITTPEDAETGNNIAVGTATVSAPRTDLYVEKRYNGGVQTPGGNLSFGVRIENRGNSATPTTLTDTLPAGLTYEPGISNLWREDTQEQLEPTIIDDETLVWDLGIIAVNESVDLSFNTIIAGTMPTGTITNAAEANGPSEDATPDDNQSSVAVEIFDSGPNLAVYKDHQWQGNHQLAYSIRVQNIGDQPIAGVIVTDTYPISTAFAGWGENDEHPFGIEWTDNYTDNQVIWDLEQLDPGQGFYAWLNVELDPAAAGVPMRWYTNTIEVTEPAGDRSPDDNIYEDVAFSGGEVEWVDLEVGREHIWACAPSGPITVTTATQEKSFDESCFDWNADRPFDPGDTITVSAGAGSNPVIIVIPTPFRATADSLTDQVAGQIDNLDTETVETSIDGTSGTWYAQTRSDGQFTINTGDIPRDGQGDVRYRTEIAYAEVTFHKVWRTQDVILRVNYGDNWVEGNYEPGHTLGITVTDSSGTIKATAVVTTGQVPVWDSGDSGFSTNVSGWTPEYLDIQPGDWVYATMDNGYTGTVQIGTITGNVDADADGITGTVTAPWLTNEVDLVCEPWGAEGAPNPQQKQTTVMPDGSDLYNCEWDAGEEWDVLPGQNIAVRYREPDGDQVYNVFAEPAPHLRLEKWAESLPGEGGNMVFEIEVRNDGEAAADNVVITDTLEGLAYLADTSGFEPSGTNPRVWEIGTLAPDAAIRFQVFAEVQSGVGEIVTNTAFVTTGTPYNQGNWDETHRTWSDEVRVSNVDISLDKWAWTGDPAPGQDVVFTLNPCNNGETASGEVVLTDTVPVSLTLSSWWQETAGWGEVTMDTQQLVVTIPSINGYRCSQVYVRATVNAAAWPGMEISNTASVTTTGDLNSGNNEAGWTGNVGWPRTNLYFDKSWSGGQLVPGAEIHYNLHLGNDGNLPITESIRITDTLPAGTSFVAAWEQTVTGSQPFTPVYSDDLIVVWELSGLDNGFWQDIDLVLTTDGIAAGTTITNCATAAINADTMEDNPYDNDACVTQTLNGAGPNLRITKFGNWENDRRIRYSVRIENIGTISAADVAITDTLPTLGTLDPNWWLDYGRAWDGSSDGAVITATLQQLDPGESAWLHFSMDFPELATGTRITNTAEITTPDEDVDPLDNVDELVMIAGPDLSIVKWADDDISLPGELVTFTLHYANATPWSLNGPVWITDTLPSGMSFVSAQQRFCSPTERFCEATPSRPTTAELVWEWGAPVNGGEWNDLIVTARVGADVAGGTVLVNQAVVASDDTGDLETTLANNIAGDGITVMAPVFAINKGAATTGIAGMPVTYTLTVTNTGNVAGTNVVFSDTVPGSLTYVDGDGTPVDGDLTWTASLESGETATGWFVAQLPCTAQTVTNDRYRVMSSAEGITSEAGAPVVVNVVAPTLSASLSNDGPAVVSETVSFTAGATTNGTTLSYIWDFGEGPVSGGLTAEHTYTQVGAHTVIFTATDTCGYIKVATTSVSVTAPDLNANFITDPAPANIVAGGNVIFTDTSTTDGPDIVAWAWNLGDGSTSTQQNPTHAYTVPGTFTVTLTITDALGYTDTLVKPSLVNVAAACTPITGVTLNVTPEDPLVRETVTMTATVAPAGATGPYTFEWDFGDGMSTAGSSVATHTYTTTGAKTVSVTVSNLCTSPGIVKRTTLTVAPRSVFLPLVIKPAD